MLGKRRKLSLNAGTVDVLLHSKSGADLWEYRREFRRPQDTFQHYNCIAQIGNHRSRFDCILDLMEYYCVVLFALVWLD